MNQIVLALTTFLSFCHASRFSQKPNIFQLDCKDVIKTPGSYRFIPQVLSDDECILTVVVPSDIQAFFQLSKESCSRGLKSPGLSAICNRPNRGLPLSNGTFDFSINAFDVFSVDVVYAPIIDVECNTEVVENDLIKGHVIRLTTNTNEFVCEIELPPVVNIEFVGFVPSTHRQTPRSHCCPDVLLTSTLLDQTPVKFNRLSACDFFTSQLGASSYHERTFLSIRNSMPGDQIFFRSVDLENEISVQDSTASDETATPPQFICKKRKLKQKLSQIIYED